MKLQLCFLVFLISLSIKVEAQWYQQNSGTDADLQSVFFIDENTGWVCGSDGTILKTTNGGLEWFEQNSNTTAGLRAVQFIDQDNGWAYGNNHILKTTNGGISWSIQDFPSPTYIVALQFVSLGTGWLIYQNSDTAYISKTTDGGITWIVQTQSENIYYQAMFFLDENNGWIAYCSGGVLRTTNAGSSWNQNDANIDCGPMSISFIDQMTGWISHNTLGSYEIAKSTDSGVNWFQQIWESGKFINSISIPSSSVGYAAGFQMFIPPNPYQEFIFKTTNSGIDWIEQYREDGELNSIFFVNDTIGWAVGKSGKILFTKSGGVTSVEGEDSFSPGKFILSQNYPNPFNPSTNIQYAVSSKELVILKVYDVLGKEVAVLINEEKQPGEYEVEFDASNLSSGIYYYQLKAGSYIETKKMLLIK